LVFRLCPATYEKIREIILFILKINWIEIHYVATSKCKKKSKLIKKTKHKKASKNSLTAEILIVICSNTPDTNTFKNSTKIKNFKMYLRNTQRLFNLSTA
jgi:hypothetical protein